jgi:hypothetical protein
MSAINSFVNDFNGRCVGYRWELAEHSTGLRGMKD